MKSARLLLVDESVRGVHNSNTGITCSKPALGIDISPVYRYIRGFQKKPVCGALANTVARR